MVGKSVTGDRTRVAKECLAGYLPRRSSIVLHNLMADSLRERFLRKMIDD